MTIGIICALSCTNISRKVPANYFLLFAFTIFETIIVSFACARFPFKMVLLAAVLTLAMTLTLSLYAWTTKTDFTVLGGVLLVALICLPLVGLVGYLFQCKFLHLLYSYLGILLFSIYIIYDTQILIGKHSFAI